MKRCAELLAGFRAKLPLDACFRLDELMQTFRSLPESELVPMYLMVRKLWDGRKEAR